MQECSYSYGSGGMSIIPEVERVGPEPSSSSLKQQQQQQQQEAAHYHHR